MVLRQNVSYDVDGTFCMESGKTNNGPLTKTQPTSTGRCSTTLIRVKERLHHDIKQLCVLRIVECGRYGCV